MSERVHLYDGEHNVIGYHVMQGKPDCRALSLPNSPENSDPYKKSSAHCLWMSKNVIVRSYNNFPATVDMPKSFAQSSCPINQNLKTSVTIRVPKRAMAACQRVKALLVAPKVAELDLTKFVQNPMILFSSKKNTPILSYNLDPSFGLGNIST